MKFKRALSPVALIDRLCGLLYLFRIFKKPIDILFECLFICFRTVVANFFAINNRNATKGYVLVITLLFFAAHLVQLDAVFAKTIEFPSLVKKLSAIPRDKSSKFGNSSIQFWKYFSQNSINAVYVGGPIRRDRIETDQFGQENNSEFFSCDSKSASSTIKFSKISSDSSHNESTRNLKSEFNDEREEIVHKFMKGAFIGWVISFIFLLFTQRQAKPPGHRPMPTKSGLIRVGLSDSLCILYFIEFSTGYR